jgi:hypothetical protein
VALQRVVDGYDAKNLTKLFIQILMARGGLIEEALSSKLLCFGKSGDCFPSGELE